ncbi:MAG: type II toxin-antitoxin system RelE/ParE family toxin [Eubacteriales bacterium]|nr:type II toxin-antitoxin system RelE/ParE family toxin [Eubacteriales bacterium]MDD4079766.1 type II toxin-antitoxin system RelE/ParE family toxin [Eubacteriales bacterium]MDD4769445.1 type II toxin-antitoxin system RelE/ParE family toxin [Eubacteriales bacterium]
MTPQISKLIYLAPAREDILDIARYHLEKIGVDSARNITEEILGNIDRLAQFPLMGPLHPDPVLAENGYRKLVITPIYVCIYKVFDDGIYIYRVVNGKTDYPKLLK